jgi:CRISPR-associated protein (TIGR03986 family)
MPDFHNPYHFIPVKQVDEHGQEDTRHYIPKAEIKEHHRSHARYAQHDSQGQPIYSGRIVCKLTTKSPTIVGNEQTVSGTGLRNVHPFEVNGKPAIPGSSLRGLISSLSEAASNSALRVLDTEHFMSYRVKMEDSLKAIGMIVMNRAGGFPRLRPLTLPAMKEDNGSFQVEKRFKRIFPKPNLPVYIDGYSNGRLIPSSFLDEVQPDSYSSDNQRYWYMELPENLLYNQNNLETESKTREYLKIKEVRGVRYLLGQWAHPEDEEFGPDDEPSEYGTRGILRVLGVEGREVNIPRTKKHELFIPYNEEMENWPTLPIDPRALMNFYAVVDERTKATVDEQPAQKLPYTLKGFQRNPQDGSIKLRDGDLVYFDVNEQGVVIKFSISSIWRDVVKGGGRVKNFFKEEKHPFNSKRQNLSLAEQVFGFVSSDSDKHATDNIPAYASRVKVSFAHLAKDENNYYEQPGIMKILGSPKLPAPAMYFKPNNSEDPGYIKKSDLDPKKHEPQGRKIYLHHYDAINKQGWRGWETHPKRKEKDLKQKAEVKPLKKEIEFFFHLDFTNLNATELGMLCYALAPDEHFHHKLGMGKPLGLGSVKIEPVGLFYIDRLARYKNEDLLAAKRYHAADMVGDVSALTPEIYKYEVAEAPSLEQGNYPSFITLRDDFQRQVDPDIHRAITLIGNPANVTKEVQVHTPIVRNGNVEEETFKWFVANENGSGRQQNKLRPAERYLEPLTRESRELPTLEPLEFRE